MRVIRLCLALIAVLSGAILAIHLIGELFPNPIAVLFTNPDGSPCQMPCLFGVRPGVTTVEEALQILNQHPFTYGMSLKRDKQSAILYNDEASIALSSLSPEGNSIDQIQVGDRTGIYDDGDSKLISALHGANPGNQILLLGLPDTELGRGNQPPYVNTYCYYANQLCFETQQWENTTPWQVERFSDLTVYAVPLN